MIIALLSNKPYEKFVHNTIKQLRYYNINYPITLIWYGEESKYDFSNDVNVITIDHSDMIPSHALTEKDIRLRNTMIAYSIKCNLYKYLPNTKIIYLDCDMAFEPHCKNVLGSYLPLLNMYDLITQKGAYYHSVEVENVYRKYSVLPIGTALMVWDNSNGKIRNVFEDSSKDILYGKLGKGVIGDEPYIAYHLMKHNCYVSYLDTIKYAEAIYTSNNYLATHYSWGSKYGNLYDKAVRGAI